MERKRQAVMETTESGTTLAAPRSEAGLSTEEILERMDPRDVELADAVFQDPETYDLYPGEWIAVRKGKVFAHAATYGEIHEACGDDYSSTFVNYIPGPDEVVS